MHTAACNWVRLLSQSVDTPGRVLEIGSRDVNGGVRLLFPHSEYVGLDSLPGRGVDVVADGAFWEGDGKPFDAVLCTEVLEHAESAREICANAHRLLRPGGIFVVTAAGEGRDPHSALDGGALREGEFYRNVPAGELRSWLAPFSFVLVSDTWNPGDVCALGVK